MTRELKDLKRLKLVKELKRGGKSKYVQLLEGNIIKKKYDRTKKEHVKHFEHEIRILKHMASSGHVPTILGVDKENLTIYMTYCGPNPEPSQALKMRLAELMQKFRNEYGLIRYEISEGGRKVEVDEIELHNICEKDGDLYLIDFGSDKWVILIHKYI